MMGLYPTSTTNNLNEWQQKNAVPPVNGVDFTKWQEELGSSALPFNLNTYPINQYGRSSDYLLSLSENNCGVFETLWEAALFDIE